MRRDGLTPNAITYTALLASCRSQPSLVPPLLQRLRREKGLASTIVLTSAISTLVHGDEDCRRECSRFCFNLLKFPFGLTSQTAHTTIGRLSSNCILSLHD
jgi:hypothetical protein